MSVIYGLLIIMLILKALFSFIGKGDTARLVEEYEKNRPDHNHYRILPHELKDLTITTFDDGRFRLNFTPISIEQVEKNYFNIAVKAKSPDGEIAFRFLINNEVHIINEKETNKSVECIITSLNTNSVGGDRLLIVLADLFGIEIGSKTQMVKSSLLYSLKQEVTLESLNNPTEFIGTFKDSQSETIFTSLKIGLNLEKGIFYIEEVDIIYRPILIKRLTFVPNIKN